MANTRSIMWISSYSVSRVLPTQVYPQLILVVRRLSSKCCWRFKCSRAQSSWFPGLWLLFECELRSFDLSLISRIYHSPISPRRIFKTTCRHIVEQYRSHSGLRQRLRRGTVDLVRFLSLGTVPLSSERQPPEVDVEKRPRSRSMGSTRPYTKPLIVRVDTILKPIDPSGRPSGAVETEVPTQLTESPAQAPIPLSPVASRSSAALQANPAGDHPAATPGEHLEAQVYTPSPPNPLSTISTTYPRAVGFPLPLDGTPQLTTHTSANASGVGIRQTETLRQRKPHPVPLTMTAFSERPQS